MEHLDIDIMRPSIIPIAIIMMMLFMIMKVFKCLQVIEYMDISLLRPDTLSLEISYFIIVVTVIKVDLGLKIPANHPLVIVEFIIAVVMGEVYIGLKRPATLPPVIVEQELMLIGDVDIGLRTVTLPPITKVDVVDCWFYQFLLVLFMEMCMNMIK